jgi:hypothetical protein
MIKKESEMTVEDFRERADRYAVGYYCPNCGGSLQGDGYTSVVSCEFADSEEYQYAAPDEGPFYCTFDGGDEQP